MVYNAEFTVRPKLGLGQGSTTITDGFNTFTTPVATVVGDNAWYSVHGHREWISAPLPNTDLPANPDRVTLTIRHSYASTMRAAGIYDGTQTDIHAVDQARTYCVFNFHVPLGAGESVIVDIPGARRREPKELQVVRRRVMSAVLGWINAGNARIGCMSDEAGITITDAWVTVLYEGQPEIVASGRQSSRRFS